MNRLTLKSRALRRRRNRSRAQTRGTASRPRLSLSISNRQIIAQLVDDEKGKTLAHSSSLKGATASISQKATGVGEDIAKQAKAAKITRVVFDRGPRRYHGRVKQLAEAARAGGLEF
jgi:large subunit ribosomal protein L18